MDIFLRLILTLSVILKFDRNVIDVARLSREDEKLTDNLFEHIFNAYHFRIAIQTQYFVQKHTFSDGQLNCLFTRNHSDIKIFSRLK